MRWLVAIGLAASVAVVTAAFVVGGSSPRRHVAGVAAGTVARTPRRRAAARPPQYVVVSFDGAGGARLWGYWRGVARRVHAHFTFFVSGAYLIDWAQRDRYSPPRESRGDSAIGFAPSEAWIESMRSQMALGFREGDEIGTHYNGHFCGAEGVGTWSAADWSSELDQFDRLLFDSGPRLPFEADDVVGGRTPCLEGKLDLLYPVLARRGFRYDASRTAPVGTWPVRRLGLWSVPLPEVPLPGHSYDVVLMDYNFLANQLDATPAAAEEEVYRTLWRAFETTYFGNRAPLSIGQHFETWKGWAYDHALERFLAKACALPEVRCTTMRTLVDWLDAHSAKQLRRFQAGRFPHRIALPIG